MKIQNCHLSLCKGACEMSARWMIDFLVIFAIRPACCKKRKKYYNIGIWYGYGNDLRRLQNSYHQLRLHAADLTGWNLLCYFRDWSHPKLSLKAVSDGFTWVARSKQIGYFCSIRYNIIWFLVFLLFFFCLEKATQRNAMKHTHIYIYRYIYVYCIYVYIYFSLLLVYELNCHLSYYAAVRT